MRDRILQKVSVMPKEIEDYREIIGDEKINELKNLAKTLKNKKIMHVNATAYGGGVAELLKAQIPLMQSLGMDMDWYVISAKPEFYDVTKMFHNTLQGKAGVLSFEQENIYLEEIRFNAEDDIFSEYDYVIIHDPQPLALIDYVKNKKGKWIWRCHIDTSSPNEEVWNFIYPYIENYDAVIFTSDEFVNQDADFKNLTFIPPSIDPLSPKNTPISEQRISEILSLYNIDENRPLITQVSRFDPWKDPMGIIEIYREIKANQLKYNLNGLQLLLAGSMANDDPEGWQIYEQILRKAGEDYDIKVYSNFHGVSDEQIKAFQQASDVVFQKSLKEGFGLTVAEAMWKGKPVIGGKVGGIKLQIADGVNGFLVSSIQEATETTLYLLQNPEVSNQMGRAAKQTVKEKFLTTREIEDYMLLFNRLREPAHA
jgi:trehalose synthase